MDVVPIHGRGASAAAPGLQLPGAPARLPGHVTRGPAGAIGRCRGRTRSPKTRASGRRAGVAAAHSERHGECREDGWKRSSVCAGGALGPRAGEVGVPAGSSTHRAIEPAEGSSRPSGLGASSVLVPEAGAAVNTCWGAAGLGVRWVTFRDYPCPGRCDSGSRRSGALQPHHPRDTFCFVVWIALRTDEFGTDPATLLWVWVLFCFCLGAPPGVAQGGGVKLLALHSGIAPLGCPW